MTILVPVLWIDGKATNLLKPIVREGNKPVYFSPSKQATSFGINVDATVLPNGLNTRFSIGTADNEGIACVTSVDPGDSKAVRGSVDVEVATKPMTLDVLVRALADGTFTLKPVVFNKRQKTTYSASEIFA